MNLKTNSLGTWVGTGVRRARYAFLIGPLALWVGASCAGSQGPAGPQGPQGPPGPGATGGSATSGSGATTGSTSGAGPGCSPGGFFCDGTTLWQCTRSGNDANSPQDCSLSSSSTNPGICVTPCPSYDGGACCARTQPLCLAAFTAPASQATWTCGPPSECTAAGTFGVFASGSYPGGACGASISAGEIILDISRDGGLGPPSTITLPSPAVILEYIGGVGGTCVSWHGSVNWESDVPGWSVAIDATCSTDGGPTLTGTLSGQL